jgi:hypothetical protein
MLGIQQAGTPDNGTIEPPATSVPASSQVRARRYPSTLVDLLAIASLLALFGSLVIDRIVDLDGPSTCWWRHLLHRDCLGCGLTHAFVAMRSGDAATATSWHPLGVAVWASAVLLATWFGLEKLLGRRLRPRWWMRALGLWGRLLGGALLLVGIVRLFGPHSPP